MRMNGNYDNSNNDLRLSPQCDRLGYEAPYRVPHLMLIETPRGRDYCYSDLTKKPRPRARSDSEIPDG